jgi:hypothetical protein
VEFLKRQMVAPLKRDYPTRQAAQWGIEESLDRCAPPWGGHPGDPERLYPNHLGREFWPGCLRCHDGDHKTRDGLEIRSDCDTCHTVLAMAEVDSLILRRLSAQE